LLLVSLCEIQGQLQVHPLPTAKKKPVAFGLGLAAGVNARNSEVFNHHKVEGTKRALPSVLASRKVVVFVPKTISVAIQW